MGTIVFAEAWFEGMRHRLGRLLGVVLVAGALLLNIQFKF
jgi:hypothetical protein